MASIVLGSMGSAIGGSLIGGTFGSAVGQLAGSFVGSFIDQNLFGTRQSMDTSGRRLSDLVVQSSVYGQMIPILFGNALIAGNIIWSTAIKETPHTRSHKSGGKGMRVKHTHTNYTYSISLAIALCEGPISSINKIWADGRPLDPTLYNMRVYKGMESQMPDILIESREGVGRTPAYRGIAYVVFENLELAEFGNRIPNFNFEVRKEIIGNDNIERAENLIESVVIIPGCGEFVYDTKEQQKFEADYCNNTWIQKGLRKCINQNNVAGKPDALLALDHLQETLPKVHWVAPVISWFASSLDIKSAVIEPGVEYKGNVKTIPSEWHCTNYDRQTARLITRKENRAIYGGTPSDESIIRYLDEIKSRNLKVMFYPMLFIDLEHKPWRGHLTGEAQYIEEFFNKEKGYNRFILHYANLVKGKVDAFIIGSELKSLTGIKDQKHKFKAVDELIKLAKKVKQILGNNVKLSYAADWSEYHHTDGGWHHLDALWASHDIDFIGIDAYFPLTNQNKSEYDIEKLMRAWESGEGYDFYYADPENKEGEMPLSPEWAWKNIKYWWENEHYDPNGEKTKWLPESKKIWFTEYGFPSIQCASNQPNVFYDPSTAESNIPLHSDGSIDLFAQRAAIHATEKKWHNSEMVERKFLWTWDARPYPYWPNLTDVWADGSCWAKGHWVQGKLGISTLGQVITELLQRTSLSLSDIDVSNLNNPIEGLCLSSPTGIKKVIQLLKQAYFFDITEQNRTLKFISRGAKKVFGIDEADLVISKATANNPDVFNIKRMQEAELPQFININFFNQHSDFQVSTAHAQRYHTSSHEQLSVNLPIIMPHRQAEEIAEIMLYNLWLERTQYTFSLPLKYTFLSPGDLVEINYNRQKHLIRITNTHFGKHRTLKIEGVAENLELYNIKTEESISISAARNMKIAETHLEVLDIPLLNNEQPAPMGRVLIAACPLSENWRGCTVFLGEHKESFVEVCKIPRRATMGAALTSLKQTIPELIDYESKIIVSLLVGELKSINFEELMGVGNLALIGNEIVQFQNAKLIGNNQYELSVFLRGRFGSEGEMGKHREGERFILLDDNLEYIELPNRFIGKKAYIKAVSYGEIQEAEIKEVIYEGKSLKPYAPCHIRLHHDGKNLRLSWIRRTRSDGILKDYVDVALYEEKEEYLVEIMNGNQYRVFTTYISELILKDDIVKLIQDEETQIKVSQISQAIGKGFEGIYYAHKP